MLSHEAMLKYKEKKRPCKTFYAKLSMDLDLLIYYYVLLLLLTFSLSSLLILYLLVYNNISANF